MKVAQLQEVRLMIGSRRLYNLGIGIGLVDVQLLASICIDPSILLCTKEKPLRKVGAALGHLANLS